MEELPSQIHGALGNNTRKLHTNCHRERNETGKREYKIVTVTDGGYETS